MGDERRVSKANPEKMLGGRRSAQRSARISIVINIIRHRRGRRNWRCVRAGDCIANAGIALAIVRRRAAFSAKAGAATSSKAAQTRGVARGIGMARRRAYICAQQAHACAPARIAAWRHAKKTICASCCTAHSGAIIVKLNGAKMLNIETRGLSGVRIHDEKTASAKVHRK